MQEITQRNFGLVIAYLIPGLVTLWGLSPFSETISAWFNAPLTNAPTVGGFLYITLGALTVGMFTSAVRWALIDQLHHKTGITPPSFEFQRLQENLSGYDLLIEIHYRHYQHYANLLIAVTFVFATHMCSYGFAVLPHLCWLIPLQIILWLASRDTFEKYCRRSESLLGKTINS